MRTIRFESKRLQYVVCIVPIVRDFYYNFSTHCPSQFKFIPILLKSIRFIPYQKKLLLGICMVAIHTQTLSCVSFI